MSFKVLHIGKFYPPHRGGMESHLETLANELSKWIDVHVLVAGAMRRQEHHNGNLRVTRLRINATLAGTPCCFEMVEEIRRSLADLVHIHWPNPAAVLAYLMSGHRAPLVVTYHSDVVRQRLLGAMFEPVLHRCLKRSGAILATSPEYIRSSTVLQAHTNKCHVVPLGVPVQDLSEVDHVALADIRRRFGPRLLLAVGRHVYYKGFGHLVKAMRHVDGRLLIIGDGPLRASLEALAGESGIRGKVDFLGEVDDITPYYHACDVFVMPSIARSEAFGIVQVEAMSAGKPIVNTWLDSGVPFVSPDQLTGVTVAPGDPGALAGAINRLLDDPDVRSQYGEAGRLRAKTLFSVDAMVTQTLAIYELILKQTRLTKPARSGPARAVRPDLRDPVHGSVNQGGISESRR